jgi:hypothetical protein
MIYLILKSFLLAHLITKFEPINWLLEIIGEGLQESNKVVKFIFNIFSLALSCLKCSSFYIGWILGGFWVGVFTTFIAYLYSQLLLPYIDKIRFQ